MRGWSDIKIKKFSGHKDSAMIDHYCKLEPSDYSDFDSLKEKHPELVLQLTEGYKCDDNTPKLSQPKEVQMWVNDSDVHKTIEEMVEKGYLFDNIVLFSIDKGKTLLAFHK